MEQRVTAIPVIRQGLSSQVHSARQDIVRLQRSVRLEKGCAERFGVRDLAAGKAADGLDTETPAAFACWARPCAEGDVRLDPAPEDVKRPYNPIASTRQTSEG